MKTQTRKGTVTPPQSDESLGLLSDSLRVGDHELRIIELPVSHCPAPGCGAEMSRGFRMANGSLVYQHTWQCNLWRTWNSEIERVQNAGAMLAETLTYGGVPNLPPMLGEEPLYESLDDYGFRGAATKGNPHYPAWFYCVRFVAYADRNGRLPSSGFGLRGATAPGIGCGKTTLLILTVREAIRAVQCHRRTSLRWWNCVTLAREVRERVRSGGLDDMVREAINTPLLILDDLGAEDPSPHLINQVLYEVINERYHASRPRPILYSTKYTLDALKERWLSAESMRGTKADNANAVISRLGQMGHCVPIQCGDLRGPRRPDFLKSE